MIFDDLANSQPMIIISIIFLGISGIWYLLEKIFKDKDKDKVDDK